MRLEKKPSSPFYVSASSALLFFLRAMARDYQALLQASRALFDEFSRPESIHQEHRAWDRERFAMGLEDCSGRAQCLHMQHQAKMRRVVNTFRADKNRWVAAATRLNEEISYYCIRIEQLKRDVATLREQNAELRATINELEVLKQSLEAERETKARRMFLEGMNQS